MSMRDVLGVLENAEDQLWATFEAAVDLAAIENARLTLAKTTEAGRTYMWLSPFAIGGAYVPPASNADNEANRLLTQAAERVPEWLPVTTILLGHDSQAALRRLVRCGRYDAVVAGPKLYENCPRFSCDLRRLSVSTFVTGDPQERGFKLLSYLTHR